MQLNNAERVPGSKLEGEGGGEPNKISPVVAVCFLLKLV